MSTFKFEWAKAIHLIERFGIKIGGAVKVLTVKRKGKPSLKLCPNHFKYYLPPKRIYFSRSNGPARSDGKGWYK